MEGKREAGAKEEAAVPRSKRSLIAQPTPQYYPKASTDLQASISVRRQAILEARKEEEQARHGKDGKPQSEDSQTAFNDGEYNLDHIVGECKLWKPVKWVGYDVTDTTWEPPWNLVGVPDDIQNWREQRIKERKPTASFPPQLIMSGPLGGTLLRLRHRPATSSPMPLSAQPVLGGLLTQDAKASLAEMSTCGGFRGARRCAAPPSPLHLFLYLYLYFSSPPHHSPPVYVCEGFLMHKECEEIIEYAAPKLSRSTVRVKQTVMQQDDVFAKRGCPSVIADLIERQLDRDLSGVRKERTSSSFFLPRNCDIERKLNSLIRELLQTAFKLHVPSDLFESMNVLHYEKGQLYSQHWDYFDHKEPNQLKQIKLNGQRWISVVLYLNDVPAGGCTGFLHPSADSLQVLPLKGRLLVFFDLMPSGAADPCTLQQGNPPHK
eukprot:gene1324-2735_t